MLYSVDSITSIALIVYYHDYEKKPMMLSLAALGQLRNTAHGEVVFFSRVVAVVVARTLSLQHHT